uniref:Uncharacterized protein n=1 Tax=Hyaloperonospora arabidopsidis (strain Emoy2) TaxID=559515 RepID=M4BXW0_HYAAE
MKSQRQRSRSAFKCFLETLMSTSLLVCSWSRSWTIYHLSSSSKFDDKYFRQLV